MDSDICSILNMVTYKDYIDLLKIYYNDKHKIPVNYELYSIKPEMFKIIHKSIDVSIDLEIYNIFINMINSLQFRKQIQIIFEINDEQIDYIIEYFNMIPSDDEIKQCKKAFINSVSKNTFTKIKDLTIIINRIEFSPSEFKKLMNNKNKYVIYSSKNLKEIYLKRYLQKPRKFSNTIEYICINNYVYRVDNLFD
jgi:hypothetical protein